MNPIIMAPTVLPSANATDYLEAAVSAGYEAVGLRLHRSLVMPFHPVVGDEAQIARIRALLREGAIRVFEVTSFYLAPEMDFAEYEAAMALGAELGAGIVLVIASDRERSRLVEHFGRLCEIARGLGQICAVENAPNGGLPTVSSIVELIEEVGVDNGAICLDPVNHITAGGTFEELRALPAKLLPYTQFADADLHPGAVEVVDGRQKHIPRLLPGEGNMDLAGLLDALPDHIPLSLELPPSARPEEEGSLSPAQWAARAKAAAETFVTDYHRAARSRERKS